VVSYTGSYSCIHLIRQVYVRFMALYKLVFRQFHRKFSNLFKKVVCDIKRNTKFSFKNYKLGPLKTLIFYLNYISEFLR